MIKSIRFSTFYCIFVDFKEESKCVCVYSFTSNHIVKTVNQQQCQIPPNWADSTQCIWRVNLLLFATNIPRNWRRSVGLNRKGIGEVLH